MRKTLLIAAAALAASVISSQAQVYSQNIVGYVNLSVPENGFNVLANQLDIGDGTNGIGQVLANGNFVSDPAAIKNSILYIWNPGAQGYAEYFYFSAADAVYNSIGTQSGWYDSAFFAYSTTPLPPGAPFVLYNIGNTSSNINFTLTGSLPVQSTNKVSIVPGFSEFAYAVPIATDIVSNGFVGTSDPAAITNDVLYVWNVGAQGYAEYFYFSAADATFNSIGTKAGFYDSAFFANTSIVPLVGQGMVFFHYGAQQEYWTNSFSF
jgi:hypothetical protein